MTAQPVYSCLVNVDRQEIYQFAIYGSVPSSTGLSMRRFIHIRAKHFVNQIWPGSTDIILLCCCIQDKYSLYAMGESHGHVEIEAMLLGRPVFNGLGFSLDHYLVRINGKAKEYHGTSLKLITTSMMRELVTRRAIALANFLGRVVPCLFILICTLWYNWNRPFMVNWIHGPLQNALGSFAFYLAAPRLERLWQRHFGRQFL